MPMDDVDRDKKVSGSIKEAIGKVTGNRPLQDEGEADKAKADEAAANKADHT